MVTWLCWNNSVVPWLSAVELVCHVVEKKEDDLDVYASNILSGNDFFNLQNQWLKVSLIYLQDSVYLGINLYSKNFELKILWLIFMPDQFVCCNLRQAIRKKWNFVGQCYSLNDLSISKRLNTPGGSWVEKHCWTSNLIYCSLIVQPAFFLSPCMPNLILVSKVHICEFDNHFNDFSLLVFCSIFCIFNA